MTPDWQIARWKYQNVRRTEHTLPDGSVLCPECRHALEAHNTRGCQVAGGCTCYQRPTTGDIQHARRERGLRPQFDRWDYRPKPRARRRPNTGDGPISALGDRNTPCPIGNSPRHVSVTASLAAKSLYPHDSVDKQGEHQVPFDVAYVNYEHGGMIGTKQTLHIGDGCEYDHRGLVRIMSDGDRWPDVLVMGEADRYEYWGGKGAWAAIAAMRDAGGRAYAWVPCELPRDTGPFAPVIFYDPHTVDVRRYYSPHAPDFAARTRNLLIAGPVRSDEKIHLVPIHGDPLVPEYRTMDAQVYRWLARDTQFSLLMGDFNEPLSGPIHEPSDLDDTEVYDKPWGVASKVELDRGRLMPPLRRSTGSLDFLCGWWDDQTGHRVHGIGFHDVCERVGIATPTDLPQPNGRQGCAIDHILANHGLAERIVPGSVRVHEPVDPDHPDSDHKRLSVAFNL
jgi:hypothetical protein